MSYTDGASERSASRLKIAAANLVILPFVGLPLLTVMFMATGICGNACNQVPAIWSMLGVVFAILAALFV